jgi:hypothetical protein
MPGDVSGADRDETVVIVFEGSINPAIITTNWLFNQHLVSQQEAQEASVRFMDDDFSRFDVSHFRIEARRDRITVAPTKALETFLPVADFMKGIFQVLIHTPIRAVAISKVVHADLEGRWEDLNDKLAAPIEWGRILGKPRVQVLSVASEAGPGAPRVEVTIEPSQFKPGGAYVVATERTDFPDFQDDDRPGARRAVARLEERWEPWLEEADAIINEILGAV